VREPPRLWPRNTDCNPAFPQYPNLVEVLVRHEAAILIGSLVGGLLQSVAFVTGIQTLLLIVADIYIAAVLTRARVPATSTPIPVREAVTV
jgi:hypothetical protein